MTAPRSGGPQSGAGMTDVCVYVMLGMQESRRGGP